MNSFSVKYYESNIAFLPKFQSNYTHIDVVEVA
jgi:hypothetical protein